MLTLSTSHEYALDGTPIPGVNQIIDDVCGKCWQASQWHLDRGKEVHQAAAYIARGLVLKSVDPQIEGFVNAVLKLWAEHAITPKMVEAKLFSRLYRYAGTLDLLCEFDDWGVLLLDYKNSLSVERTKLQLGGYSHLIPGKPVLKGIAVELHEDGTYKLGCDDGKPWDLRRPRNEFLALLTAYNVRRRLKVAE